MRKLILVLASAAALYGGLPGQARSDDQLPDNTALRLAAALWGLDGFWPAGSGNGNGNGNIGSFNGNFNQGNGNGNGNIGSFNGNGNLGNFNGNGNIGDCLGNFHTGDNYGNFVDVGRSRNRTRCDCFMLNSAAAHRCLSQSSPGRVRP